jgi:hypothetical protein
LPCRSTVATVERESPQFSARIAVHRKTGILPFDFDEEVGHIHLLAVNDLGDIQHAQPHRYHIGIAAGVGPDARGVASNGSSVCDCHRSNQAERNGNKESRDG